MMVFRNYGSCVTLADGRVAKLTFIDGLSAVVDVDLPKWDRKRILFHGPWERCEEWAQAHMDLERDPF